MKQEILKKVESGEDIEKLEKEINKYFVSNYINYLKENNYLNCDPRPITHMVKFYEKGNLPIEFVTSRQWFVKLLDKKEEMLEAGRQIKWKPHYMQHRYEEWVKGLNQDWCISRQRFFGVPFPVWYKIDEKGNVDYNSPIIAELSQLLSLE